ncbi:MAG: hypothetical protein J6V90_08270 [Treponema sp.]|nr:hypothetical protein [Treponema sp.]
MTDNEKLQTIKQWIDEAISQGNKTILVMAIKSILLEKGEDEIEIGYGAKLKLTEKSKKILKDKESI